ncbi:hypothetical protein VH441_08325 [Psychrobacter sp. HD31]|uniref:hypothetical protein n=1 Tax=Psychrobacter sp. HD31 TaxID=3112003 RepID=UPI003DA6A43F
MKLNNRLNLTQIAKIILFGILGLFFFATFVAQIVYKYQTKDEYKETIDYVALEIEFKDLIADITSDLGKPYKEGSQFGRSGGTNYISYYYKNPKTGFLKKLTDSLEEKQWHDVTDLVSVLHDETFIRGYKKGNLSLNIYKYKVRSPFLSESEWFEQVRISLTLISTATEP